MAEENAPTATENLWGGSLSHKKFSGKIEEIWENIFCTPKNSLLLHL